MGEQKLVNKTISPQEIVRGLMAGSITTAQAQQMFNGVMPIGDFKGIAAILDLDALVRQPLVLAEQQHILGILDGREEDYDLQTLTPTAGEAIATNHDASLTVPTGEVWYLNNVQGEVPNTAACSMDYQWFCDLWPDHAEASPATAWGQAFQAVRNTGVASGLVAWDDEFGWLQILFTILNKEVMLRLPAGTMLRCRFTTRTAVGEAVACTFKLFGFIGKSLVD